MPITGKVHQPPPVHQVFEGHNFVICNFVPRKVDYHELAVPVPYYHSNVDSDEIMFYVDGDYEARKGSGIGKGSISIHPGGHPHGPQPGAVEASLGVEYFDETAVMVDTFRPLDLGPAARATDDGVYASSWTGGPLALGRLGERMSPEDRTNPEDPTSEVPAQFLGFFDDAATFPPGPGPGRAGGDRARTAQVASRWAASVGPAVLALADLDAARRVAAGLDLADGPVEVSVVTPAGALDEALAAGDRLAPQLRVVAIELKTDPDDEQTWTEQIRAAAAVEGLPVFVELSARQVGAGALDLLAGTGLRLKFRTGGIEAHLFPTPTELADVLVRAIDAGIPFKLTAGLHEAVRYTDPATGFDHHGFLNIAMAAEAARAGRAGRRRWPRSWPRRTPRALARLGAPLRRRLARVLPLLRHLQRERARREPSPAGALPARRGLTGPSRTGAPPPHTTLPRPAIQEDHTA